MFTPDYVGQLLAWALLHFAWQGLFIVISSRVCDFVLHKSTSPFRYRVFCLHFAALGIVPFLTLLVSHRALAAADPVSGSGSPGPFGLPFSWFRSLLLPPFHLLVTALPCILALWMVGVLVGGWLVLRGPARYCRLQRLYPNSGTLANIIDDLVRKLGIRTRLTVLEAEVTSPFIIGMRKPRLVLPWNIEQQLTPEELRAILAHELAHVKRSDYCSNFLQMLLLVLLWPHPAAWILWAQLRREREACCDEASVQLCGSAVPLARALYRLAVKAPPFDIVVAAAAGSLEVRMQRLLAANRSSSSGLSVAAPALAMVALALSTTFVAQTLRADEATRIALVASRFGPTISIRAHDPAGLFFVRLRGGRVLGVSIGDESIPPAQVIQQGNSVRILDRSGLEVLAIRVDPRGGIAWQPRAEQSHSTFQ